MLYHRQCKLDWMKTLADRIKHIRSSLDETQEVFGNRVGVTKATVSQWEDGRISSIRSTTLLKLEESTGYSARWIESGRGQMLTRNVSDGPSVQSLPLISWVQAGGWSDIVDNFRPGQGEKIIYTTKKISGKAFALRVVGDSMENPNGRPTYPEGSIIIVEPERPAIHGSPVVVRLDDEKQAVFKQLIIDGDSRYLKPLNPRYPVIKVDSDSTICGVVIQTILDEDGL